MLPDRLPSPSPFHISLRAPSSTVSSTELDSQRMYLFSLPSLSDLYTTTLKEKKMDPTYSSQGFDDTYSHHTRSRAGSGVSTTEGLLQNLQLAETTSFETASYTSSRPPSSRGLASPAYLSPSLSHSPGYLATPLSQPQQSFPPFSSDAVVSHQDWFEEEQARTQGAPLLRLEPAHDQLSAPPSSPPPGIYRDRHDEVQPFPSASASAPLSGSC